MRVIDLSHRLEAATPPFPGDAPVRLSPYRTMERDQYTAYLLETGLHAGTHIDMPRHLVRDDRDAADFPPELFMGPGLCLDVRGQARIDPDPGALAAIRPGDIVLLHTGHDALYGRAEYFASHPAISEAFAGFLIQRGVKMLGMDMPSPDRPPYIQHKALLRAGIFLLENLTHLEALQGHAQMEIIALPLKIAAEASPVRAVCRVDR